MTNKSSHYGLGALLVLVAFFDVVGPGNCSGKGGRPEPEAAYRRPDATAGSQTEAQQAVQQAAEAQRKAALLAALIGPEGVTDAVSDSVVAAALASSMGTVPASAAVPPTTAAPAAAALPLLDFVEVHVGGAVAGTELPLVVAIHGLGDSPEAFARLFSGYDRPARVLVPRGKRPFGRGFTWFRLQNEPEGTRAADVKDTAERLVALVKARQAAAPTRGKPVVTGFSQGGILSFYLAAHHAEVFAAAVPIAGRLSADTIPPPVDAAATKKACKIIALHGDVDTRIDHASGKSTVDALAKAGYDATLKTFVGVGHAIPPVVRAALFETLHGTLP
jgi:phospholipase/carboxylesterase